MDARTRFIVFGAGACLGALLLWFFNQHGAPAREHRKAVMASLSLPGMYYDAAVQQKSLFGHYVQAERRSQRPDGGVRREIITGGRNRFDENGQAMANDLLFITEDYAPGIEPSEEATVQSITFAYADRAEVVLIPDSAADWKCDARFSVKPTASKPQQLGIGLRDTTKLNGAELFSLVDYVRAIDGKSPVVSARIGTINWQAEADLIRKESGK